MNSSSIPKYQVINDDLKRLALEKGEGYRIPTISALIDQYGVSSTTVLRAIKDLTNEGLLVSSSLILTCTCSIQLSEPVIGN